MIYGAQQVLDQVILLWHSLRQGGGVSKSKMKSVGVAVGICSVCDLCSSYYRTHSILGVIVGIVLGLGSTTFWVLV